MNDTTKYVSRPSQLQCRREEIKNDRQRYRAPVSTPPADTELIFGSLEMQFLYLEGKSFAWSVAAKLL